MEYSSLSNMSEYFQFILKHNRFTKCQSTESKKYLLVILLYYSIQFILFNEMAIIGKSTIHPILFYSGKIAGYIIWILYILALSGNDILNGSSHIYLLYTSYFITIVALLLILLSSFGLGKSIRLGLPVENTNLKTKGIYKFSRNPMYVGFNLLTISGMIYFLNATIFLLGLYSLLIYHFIILGEERFLSNRFGEQFRKYKMKTRRYV